MNAFYLLKVAATGSVCGDLSNPLLVQPLQPAVPAPFQRAQQPVESESPISSDLVGAGHQALEDLVLMNLRKV